MSDWESLLIAGERARAGAALRAPLRVEVADDGQDLVGIVGYRNTAGYTDALWVFGEDDCRAVRLLPDDDLTGGIVWEHHGRLADCGHELLALPEPDDRHAPKLVRARLLLPDRPATGRAPGGS